MRSLNITFLALCQLQHAQDGVEFCSTKRWFALVVGPDVKQVEQCSHLTAPSVRLLGERVCAIILAIRTRTLRHREKRLMLLDAQLFA